MGTNIDLSKNILVTNKIPEPHMAFEDHMARILDVSIIMLAAPYIILVLVIIAISTKMDSRGPVFYRHERIGRYGRKFYVYKFRTMVQNADQILKDYLDSSPESKAQWLETQKLKQDPRITRLGNMLRKSSLDELPQLWNILLGDMSLVGPRPIVDSEVEKYGQCFDLYIKVRPGLTGLWQVSGRNNTTYEHRVELDEYYVHNRSVKLYFKILWKTIFVVLKKEGAY